MGSERKQILAEMISILMYNICFGVQTRLVLLVLTGNAGKKSDVKSISLGLCSFTKYQFCIHLFCNQVLKILKI